MEKFKVIVIGGGTAGLKVATRSSKKVKTLLVEPGMLGGTCLNTGCIPTKALIYASHLYALTKEMDYFGVKAKATINFKKLSWVCGKYSFQINPKNEKSIRRKNY